MLRRALPVALLLLAATLPKAGHATSPDPFAFLPRAAALGAADRGRLDTGQTVVKMLPGRGREVGVVAAVRTTASPDRLIAWTQEIAALRRGRYVPVIGRFSDPPGLDDLQALTLDESDLADLRRCRPGDCGVKLAGSEIAALQRVSIARADWKDAVEQEFRRVVLERVRRYLSDGDGALFPYVDHATPVGPGAETEALIAELGLSSSWLSDVADYVRRYPHAEHPDVVDSFVYWAKEVFGGKPIISVTHVMLLRNGAGAGPAAITISKQLYASHYRTGSLSLTAMSESGAGRHLVYLQRSHVDVLQGLFGGLARRVVEGRIRDEAPAVLASVRARLESGDPPEGVRNISRNARNSVAVRHLGRATARVLP